jgi:hypothetical protein
MASHRVRLRRPDDKLREAIQPDHMGMGVDRAAEAVGQMSVELVSDAGIERAIPRGRNGELVTAETMIRKTATFEGRCRP